MYCSCWNRRKYSSILVWLQCGGIPMAYAMDDALAGFTVFVAILGRYNSASNDNIDSCCSVLEQRAGLGLFLTSNHFQKLSSQLPSCLIYTDNHTWICIEHKHLHSCHYRKFMYPHSWDSGPNLLSILSATFSSFGISGWSICSRLFIGFRKGESKTWWNTWWSSRQ